MNAPRFANLDALRGLAALSVFGYHLSNHLGVRVDGSLMDVLRLPLVMGWMGVDLFIVISGCVISLLVLTSPSEHWSPTRFLLQRLARIAPLHWLTLALFVVLLPWPLPAERWISFAANFSFVHIFRTDWYGQFNGPSWSIALEMQFYLLMALTAARVRTANKFVLLGSCLVISIISKLLVMATFGFQVDLLDPGQVHKLVVRVSQLPVVLDQFAAGYFVAACLVQNNIGQPNTNSQVRRATARRVLFLVVGFLFAVYFAIWYAAVYPEVDPDEAWNYVFIRTLFGWMFAALVWAACNLGTVPAIWLVRWLGERSYGIYLWHTLVIAIVKDLGPMNSFSFSFLALSGTLICASLSWSFLERPAVAWVKHKTASRVIPANAQLAGSAAL
jgi:peptidoglycan/LPS O-acetylase OafA/YrhL